MHPELLTIEYLDNDNGVANHNAATETSGIMATDTSNTRIKMEVRGAMMKEMRIQPLLYCCKHSKDNTHLKKERKKEVLGDRFRWDNIRNQMG